MKTALESLRNASALYNEKLVKLMKSFGMTIAEHRLLLLIESGLDTQEKYLWQQNLILRLLAGNLNLQ